MSPDTHITHAAQEFVPNGLLKLAVLTAEPPLNLRTAFVECHHCAAFYLRCLPPGSEALSTFIRFGTKKVNSRQKGCSAALEPHCTYKPEMRGKINPLENTGRSSGSTGTENTSGLWAVLLWMAVLQQAHLWLWQPGSETLLLRRWLSSGRKTPVGTCWTATWPPCGESERREHTPGTLWICHTSDNRMSRTSGEEHHVQLFL